MNRVRRTIMPALAALALLATSPAAATTVERMSLDDLARKSDAIVLARVEDQTARYDANREIFTYVTLQVLEPVKGAKKGELVTIRQLGGTIGDVASIVSGTPTFQRGEDVVLFLTRKDSAGFPWVMGLQQGKYSVTTDATGQKQVRNELDGITTVAPGGRPSKADVATQPLQAFLDGLRTRLDEPGKVRIDPTVK